MAHFRHKSVPSSLSLSLSLCVCVCVCDTPLSLLVCEAPLLFSEVMMMFKGCITCCAALRVKEAIMPGCVLFTTPQTATPLSFALSIHKSIACYKNNTSTIIKNPLACQCSVGLCAVTLNPASAPNPLSASKTIKLGYLQDHFIVGFGFKPPPNTFCLANSI